MLDIPRPNRAPDCCVLRTALFVRTAGARMLKRPLLKLFNAAAGFPVARRPNEDPMFMVWSLLIVLRETPAMRNGISMACVDALNIFRFFAAWKTIPPTARVATPAPT